MIANGGPTHDWFDVNRDSLQATGLRHWWPMLASMGASSVRDLHLGLNAALQGNAQVVPDAEMGAALLLDGNGDFGDCGSTFQPSGSPWAYSAWVYPVDVNGFDAGQDQVMGAGYNGVGTGLAMGWSFGTFSNRLGIIAYNGAVVYGAYTGKTWGSGDLNQWWHLLGGWDGTAYRVYVNGVSDTTVLNSQIDPYQSSVKFCLGAQDQNGTRSQYFTGRIADLRVYDYLPSPATIYQMWAPESRFDLYDVLDWDAFEAFAAQAVEPPGPAASGDGLLWRLRRRRQRYH